MIRPLGLRVAHMPGESPQSLASRLAIRNGVGFSEFARHMRLSPTDVANGRPGALEDLATLAGMDVDALRREAMVGRGETWAYRGETLSEMNLRRLRLRACPRCLAEDVAGAAQPRWAAYGRSVWMVEQIRTCARHEVGLVPAAAWTGLPAEDWDVAARVAPLLHDVARRAAEAPTRIPTRLERYLLGRLDGVRAGGWLDGLPFHVAAVACEWIGAVALHGPDVATRPFDDDDRRAAGDAGHEVASDGRAGLSAFCDGMRRLVAAAKSNTDGQKVFGHLWHFLQAREDDADYEPLRRVMAELMAEAKPVAAGSTVLGVPIDARRRHSVWTGALASGVHVKTFRAMLEREGLLDGDGPRATPGLTFVDADRLDGVMGRLARSLNYKDAMAYLNAPRHAAWEIYEAGIVAPRSRMVEGSHARKLYLEFAREDLDAFLAALDVDAEGRDEAGEGEVDLRRAARENFCGIAEVVRLVLDRRLPWVGRLATERGFASVLVRGADVAPLVRGEEPDGLTEGRVRHRLRARHESVPILVADGLLELFEARHPRTRAPQRYVSFESLERFEAEYASLSARAFELGMPPNRLKARLLRWGIEPALPPDRYFSAFYLRGDLSRYAGDRRRERRVTEPDGRWRAGTRAGPPGRRAAEAEGKGIG